MFPIKPSLLSPSKPQPQPQSQAQTHTSPTKAQSGKAKKLQAQAAAILRMQRAKTPPPRGSSLRDPRARTGPGQWRERRNSVGSVSSAGGMTLRSEGVGEESEDFTAELAGVIVSDDEEDGDEGTGNGIGIGDAIEVDTPSSQPIPRHDLLQGEGRSRQDEQDEDGDAIMAEEQEGQAEPSSMLTPALRQSPRLQVQGNTDDVDMDAQTVETPPMPSMPLDHNAIVDGNVDGNVEGKGKGKSRKKVSFGPNLGPSGSGGSVLPADLPEFDIDCGNGRFIQLRSEPAAEGPELMLPPRLVGNGWAASKVKTIDNALARHTFQAMHGTSRCQHCQRHYADDAAIGTESTGPAPLNPGIKIDCWMCVTPGSGRKILRCLQGILDGKTKSECGFGVAEGEATLESVPLKRGEDEDDEAYALAQRTRAKTAEREIEGLSRRVQGLELRLERMAGGGEGAEGGGGERAVAVGVFRDPGHVPLAPRR